jgi:hypothetical protein
MWGAAGGFRLDLGVLDEWVLGSGAAPLGFPFVDWIMVQPVFPALSLFLLSPLFLFFALFATVAHGAHLLSV